MSTQQITFAIQGMRGACPKCAGEIERELTQLDGIVAAQVNYATERATVVYDPARIMVFQMVQAIRQKGFDTPVEHLTFHSDDLLYATSAGTVEKVLGKIEGVVQVSADLAARTVTLEIFPDDRRRRRFERTLATFGFHQLELGAANPRMLFLMRGAILMVIELLALWSAGAHVGWLDSPGSLHAPLVIVGLSMLTLFVAGSPFYRFAFDAVRHGEFDAIVIAALLASVFAVSSLPISMLSPTAWLPDIGLITATTLTAGWFIARALTLWVIPRFRGAARKVNLASAAQAQLGVVSNGSHQ